MRFRWPESWAWLGGCVKSVKTVRNVSKLAEVVKMSKTGNKVRNVRNEKSALTVVMGKGVVSEMHFLAK